VSGLTGLFEVNRAAWLVQPGDSHKVSVRILGRDPPLKHHSTRARHGEQIAIPRRLRGVGGQGAVGVVVVDEPSKSASRELTPSAGGSLAERWTRTRTVSHARLDNL
jgi:hypothetical protein